MKQTKKQRKQNLKEKIAELRNDRANIIANIIDPAMYHLEHRKLAKKRNWNLIK